MGFWEAYGQSVRVGMGLPPGPSTARPGDPLPAWVPRFYRGNQISGSSSCDAVVSEPPAPVAPPAPPGAGQVPAPAVPVMTVAQAFALQASDAPGNPDIASPMEGGLWQRVYGVPAPALSWEALWVRSSSRGIPQLGNTCFVSAVAQVLCRIAPVRALLAAHRQECGRPARSCGLCALAMQASVLLDDQGGAGARDDESR